MAEYNIAFQLVEHQAVFTVAESSKLDRDIAGAHTKNLFLKDSDGRFWLLTVPADKRVDLKQLPHLLGCKRVSFAKAEDMERLLRVSPGSVTPLSVLNDVDGLVSVVLAVDLMTADIVNVHPLRNTATLGLAPADLRHLLVGWNHVPDVLVLPYSN